MVIGLTGGIGSGKSTVSDYLREKGYTILDADEISRNLTKNDAAVRNEIKKVFGDEAFDESGQLNRKKVADLVFSNTELKEKLERIVTERVIEISLEEIANWKKKRPGDILFFDAPLLFEFGLDAYTDESWVVYAPKKKRIERVVDRDKVSPAQVEARIKNQMPYSVKNRKATHVLDNSKDFPWLKNQVDELILHAAEKNNCKKSTKNKKNI